MTRYLDESDVMMVEEGFTTRDLLESLLLKVAQTVRTKAVGFPGNEDGGSVCVCGGERCISFQGADCPLASVPEPFGILSFDKTPQCAQNSALPL